MWKLNTVQVLISIRGPLYKVLSAPLVGKWQRMAGQMWDCGIFIVGGRDYVTHKRDSEWSGWWLAREGARANARYRS